MLIGAYYYAWYSQNWLRLTVRKDAPPLLGEYDNTLYGKVIEEHMRMAKKAGIDFLSVSWQPDGHYGHILEGANRMGMKMTYFYETLSRANGKASIPLDAKPLIVEDMKKIADEMEEDCWLKVDGRPVLMLYVTRCFRDNEAEFLSEIRSALPNAFIVGDEIWWEEIPDSRIEMLDAITFYNMYRKDLSCFDEYDPERVAFGYLENCKPILLRHAEQCRRLGRPLWGCAMPGYDDRGVRPDKGHPAIPRLGGDFFRRSLQDALEISGGSPLMITSYGEWYEDTQIEPAESYGSLYLDILRDFKEKAG